MDRYIIENFFLKVGRSYYKSGEFLRTRSLLRKKGLDFSPVAEFGIGVMAVFMLGDRIEVETSLWSLARRDGQLRHLSIDGVGRLIEVKETDNAGPARFYGTRVTVQLTSKKEPAPTWQRVKQYIQDVCRNLDFILTLEHVTVDGTEVFEIHPEGLRVPVPSHLTETAFHIPVDVKEIGLKGEIVFYRAPESAVAQAALASETPIQSMDRPMDARMYGRTGILTRGGFAIGGVPGLPSYTLSPEVDARIEVTRSIHNDQALPVTNLGRSRLTEQKEIEASIFKTWLEALLNSLADIEARPIGEFRVDREQFRNAKWLENYSAFDLFRLAKTCWPYHFRDVEGAKTLLPPWERGEGRSIWAGDSYSQDVSSVIFEFILPKVTSIVVGANGNYFVRPLGSGWQDVLRSWRSFVRDGMSWPVFAEYLQPHANIFYDTSSSKFLNKKFEDRFRDFDLAEIKTFPSLLDRLTSARRGFRSVQFERSEIDLLLKLLASNGDLVVQRYEVTKTLGELIAGSGQMLESS